MTENENEVIKRLKESLKDIKDYLNSSNDTEEGIKLSTALKVTSLGSAIEDVLYFVEKKTDELIKTYDEELKENYISKDTIRKKIEKIKNETWYIDGGNEAKNACIEELEQLLEE